jgi:ComF family protein
MAGILYQRLNSAGRELLRGVLHLVSPEACIVCAAQAPLDRPNLCLACRAILTTDSFHACPRCAANVGPHVLLEDGCTHCRDETFHFEHVLRLGQYDGLLREAVLRMKHASGEILAEVLGGLWGEHLEAGLRAAEADVVIPVPLHWWRRLQRGYNQSAALARAVAAQLRVPCKPGWLRRIRHTPVQTSLSSTDRRQNLRGAFRASAWARLQGRTVLLVDDVLTSGSTASQAARSLREAGAARVVVGVLARSHV